MASLSLSGCKGLEDVLDWIDLGEDNDRIDGDTFSAVKAGNWAKALPSSAPLAAYRCSASRPLGLSSSSLSPTCNKQLGPLVKAGWPS